MKKRTLSLFLFVFFAFHLLQAQNPSTADGNTVVIQNVHYFHTPSASFKLGTVVLRDGKITEVGKKAVKVKDAMVIDGTDKWLVPGLVDTHIHLFQSGGLYTRPDALDLTEFRSYEEEREWLKVNAGSLLQRYLKLGITTVVDVGGPLSNFAIRDQFKGSDVHPSLYLAGPLISTYQPEAFEIDDAPIIKANTPEEARELVRAQLDYKPDFIKIWYIALRDQPASSTYDIVEATIQEAHSHGLRVAVHATQLSTAKLALKAGADLLVHSIDDPLDKEGRKILIEKEGLVYVPTLGVHEHYDQVFSSTYIPTELDFSASDPFMLGTLYDVKIPAIKEMLEPYERYITGHTEESAKVREEQGKNLVSVQKAGITVATGTDAGNIGTLHASSYFEELDRMTKAGLTNAEILVASTSGGAAFVNPEADFGTIEPGMRADLVLLHKNPLSDIQNLQAISQVIKNGKTVPLETLNPSTPESLVQQQLNAYNARDIDAFLEPYADDVEIYNFPNELQSKGKDKIRPNYASMFESLPDLHCKLVSRMVNGNTVIDQEFVTLSEGRTLEAIAIYEVENGKIARVYFIQ